MTRPITLRVTDQETARVVQIFGAGGAVIGAGCLVSGQHVLTCRHVFDDAVAHLRKEARSFVKARLVGATDQPEVTLRLLRKERGTEPANDLALLEISGREKFNIPDIEFAAPLRHAGKRFSALGFPDGDPQGRNVSGVLHSADAKGLVQMDGASALIVKGGFSGAPVWSSDVKGFVGIVVTELSDRRVAWCIPSHRLAKFLPTLPVRFRVPPSDRPEIHDYEIDDPNLQLFGTISDDGHRTHGAHQKQRGLFRGQGEIRSPQEIAALSGSLCYLHHIPELQAKA
jgi:hypothetical protein